MNEETTIKDGGSAFPILRSDQAGMSLRDWLAGMSLDIASKLEHAHPTGSEGQPTYAGIATRAYYMADAMLCGRKQ